MIVEFETSPYLQSLDTGMLTRGLPSSWHNEWEGKVSVDLKWVASARPKAAHGFIWTEISMAGSGGNQAFGINIPYSEFMPMWMKAKGETP